VFNGCQTLVLPDGSVPSVEEATAAYVGSGGVLTMEHDVGQDLLKTHPGGMAQRDADFLQQMRTAKISVKDIFSAVVNHDHVPLQRCILLHIFLSGLFMIALTCEIFSALIM